MLSCMTKTIYGGAEEGAAMNHRPREVMDAVQCLITYNKTDEASNARRAENHVEFRKRMFTWVQLFGEREGR